MAVENVCLILVIVCCVVFGHEELSLKTSEATEEQDVHVIRQTMENLATKPGVQFVEYGPDGTAGYKYHLTSAENKEYIIHTTGPITVPVLETIKGTREEKDINLLARLIASTKIKSMESIDRKDLTL
nr:uncharacterized protein LOC109429893 [Aedes albopictus]